MVVCEVGGERRKALYFLPWALGGDLTLLDSHAYIAKQPLV